MKKSLEELMAESPDGPLPPAILADMADQLADFLANFAGELDLASPKWGMDVEHFRQESRRLVALAKDIRGQE